MNPELIQSETRTATIFINHMLMKKEYRNTLMFSMLQEFISNSAKIETKSGELSHALVNARSPILEIYLRRDPSAGFSDAFIRCLHFENSGIDFLEAYSELLYFHVEHLELNEKPTSFTLGGFFQFIKEANPKFRQIKKLSSFKNIKNFIQTWKLLFEILQKYSENDLLAEEIDADFFKLNDKLIDFKPKRKNCELAEKIKSGEPIKIILNWNLLMG